MTMPAQPEARPGGCRPLMNCAQHGMRLGELYRRPTLYSNLGAT
ncbi:hypothetical protein RSPO_m00879 (plasmid) [Ralstonia solanacearum Po82]|uniref:Uncharacterized protein n=1 Tax=Ralstonia solanacearum (strain Po82) TaxID=1031711 RepID=F6GA73_RALS8|nr:hypothetical protein RSPO_m00879 [Ralstonia solanacearum Po82]